MREHHFNPKNTMALCALINSVRVKQFNFVVIGSMQDLFYRFVTP